jgi:hypothetical protein
MTQAFAAVRNVVSVFDSELLRRCGVVIRIRLFPGGSETGAASRLRVQSAKFVTIAQFGGAKSDGFDVFAVDFLSVAMI